MERYRYGMLRQDAPFLPIMAILAQSIPWHGREDHF